MLAISVDKMAIQFVFVTKTRITPASTVVFVDTWQETVSIVAEDVDEVEVLIEEADIEDELKLEEGEVKMLNLRRK